MAWSFQVHDTITGRFLMLVHPSAGSWRRAFGKGSGSHTFQLRERGSEWVPAMSRWLFAPNKRDLVVLWDGVPVYAGMILSTKHDRATGALVVSHVEGVRFHFRNRLTFGVYGFTPEIGNLIQENRSIQSVVNSIIRYGVGADGRGGPEWGLPIDLPPTGAGTHSFEWFYHEWNRIDDLLDQVEAKGFEIEFEPYLTETNQLRYRTRVQEKLTAGALDFPVSVDHSAVSKLDVTVDGSKQVTGVFIMGKGSEADMRYGQAGGLAGPDMPVRDAARSAKDVDNWVRLGEMARADLALNVNPVEQWEFDLTHSADHPVDVRLLRTGVTLRLAVHGDPFIEDGIHEMRLIGLSGDMSMTVNPEVQAA